MNISTSFKISLSVALLALASNVTQAAESSTKSFTPLSANGSSQKADNYAGGSMGSSSTGALCGTLQNCDSSTKGWKLFAGIRMNDNVMLEGGYVNFGEQHAKDANGEVTQKATAFTTAALATYPMNEQIELFGKAGLARWTDKYTDSTGSNTNKGTDVLVGVGANYDIGDNMGIRTEWERFKGIGTATQKGDVDLLSVGLTFSSL